MAIMDFEHRFPFIALSNVHQVVCSMYIHLDVHFSMIELVQQPLDQRQRVLITMVDQL
jgi:hypothetical protein